MHRSFFSLLLCALPLLTGLAQTDRAGAPVHVLGSYGFTDLLETADAEWLSAGKAAYQPNPTTVAKLAPAVARLDEVVIYYGSWCGDSRREVPRMIKTLTLAGCPLEKLRFVGVDDQPKTYKKSPDGAAKGKHIYRVPTFTFQADGAEIGRIIEHAKISVEYDLLALLTTDDYRPAYPAFVRLAELDRAGLLSDPNVSGNNLRMEFGPLVYSPATLNSAAYVLLGEGRAREAAKLLYANVRLFPEYANGYDSLAEVTAELGKYADAAAYQRKALALDPAGPGYQDRYAAYLRQVPE